jgi:hypothetical protein
MGGLRGVGRRKCKKALLFEKRSKNFCNFVRALHQRARLVAKVFWFFFSKKERLLTHPSASSPAQSQPAVSG